MECSRAPLFAPPNRARRIEGHWPAGTQSQHPASPHAPRCAWRTPRAACMAGRCVASDAMAGVEQGVRGMRVGGRRVLVLPPDLALGPDTEPPNMVGSVFSPPPVVCGLHQRAMSRASPTVHAPRFTDSVCPTWLRRRCLWSWSCCRLALQLAPSRRYRLACGGGRPRQLPCGCDLGPELDP